MKSSVVPPGKDATVEEIGIYLAATLELAVAGVIATIRMIDEGATVPFIARYRKEATGNLDEVQIRLIGEQLVYTRELADRKDAILKSIEEQGKLTPALTQKIVMCTSKADLEDLYLPFKPKRRTKAMIAREAGLEPLAMRILEQPEIGDPTGEATTFINAEKGVETLEAALTGAREIIQEMVSERPDVRGYVREVYAKEGVVHAEASADKPEGRTKYEDYYDYREGVAAIPSHRYLAIRRGEEEKILRFTLEVDTPRVTNAIETLVGVKPATPFGAELKKAVTDAVRFRVCPSVATDTRVELKMRADREAVEIFAQNLEQLLLAAPLGSKSVIGIDPGIRTGCKCAVVDLTGKFLDHNTIYTARGENEKAGAARTLLELVSKHKPAAIAVGSGTGGRETERFVRDVLKLRGESAEAIPVVLVDEDGASVYSASDVARLEFPDLDLTIRGAISIARRLQDPLAELVKIDPKSIGVGQYQHDISPTLMEKKLGEVVESCVNRVGVELNTASAPLLARVAGLTSTIAKRIVDYREKNGMFRARKELLKVTGLGPKTFEQAAGFLRVRDAEHPLDKSAVHPERYALVEKMASDLGVDVSSLVGNASLVSTINVAKYVDETVGELTLKDILSELKKPGLDPRKGFEPPAFRDDINSIEDLKEGMMLEGVVSNVTAFGAFVDLGVHQDGLVHVSQLADRFVKNPSEVVKVGDKLRVRVMEVDLQRGRIALSARTTAEPGQAQGARGAAPQGGAQGPQGQGQGGNRKPGGQRPAPQQTFANNPFRAFGQALQDRLKG